MHTKGLTASVSEDCNPAGAAYHMMLIQRMRSG